jgi:hypothetical protein
MTMDNGAEVSVGDAIPPGYEVIEVHVANLRQLFNAMDPSPFGDKDLDPRAEEFIVGWSKEVRRDASLALLVHLERSIGLPHEAVMLRSAVSAFFNARATTFQRRLREMFRRGRTSLVIGLVFLAVSMAVGNALAIWTNGNHAAELLREGFAIGGWVAMWRPLEVFLYDWWPIRDDVRLFERLAAMPVAIRYAADGAAEAGRSDFAIPQPNARRMSRPPDLRATEHALREAALDHTLADSFPASDPLSSIPNPLYRGVGS